MSVPMFGAFVVAVSAMLGWATLVFIVRRLDEVRLCWRGGGDEDGSSPMTERSTITLLADDGYIARAGEAVVVRTTGNSHSFAIAGDALEAVLRACLEVKGVEVGGTYTIREPKAGERT